MNLWVSYSAQASSITQVAVVSSTPNQTFFYNLEDVLFFSGLKNTEKGIYTWNGEDWVKEEESE